MSQKSKASKPDAAQQSDESEGITLERPAKPDPGPKGPSDAGRFTTDKQVQRHSDLTDINLRETVGQDLISLVHFWMAGVLVILVYQIYRSEVGLSTTTLSVLLTTTTLNVTGLLYIVAKYVFPDEKTPSVPTRPRPTKAVPVSTEDCPVEEPPGQPG